jgi:phenylalanyl-tRNA synthetase alpha chain
MLNLSQINTIPELDNLKATYLGKEGSITLLLRTLKDMTAEEKKTRGAEINRQKVETEELFANRRTQIETAAINAKLMADKVDLSLPHRPLNNGSIHPITKVINEIKTIFNSMGYSDSTGPEIEDDYHNFTALNIPENHPARAMQDTFYFGDGRLLRTQTSSIQIRAMKNGVPPFAIFATGKTYRSDSDATHSPMFHQAECLYVAESVNMGHLKYTMNEFLCRFFEVEKVDMRLRPSFFPFTEPSSEVDIKWGERWLEVLGAGLVHPSVLENAGVDSKKYTGFAFGVGIERLAMLKYGIDDLRLFYSGDSNFLEHYSGI